MKRLFCLLLAALLAASMCACGAAQTEAAATAAPTEEAVTPAPATPEPTPPPEPVEPTFPAAPEGWAEGYLSFLENNYDIFAALWPEGLTGVGFIDLDLDGMPEMVVFDLGASATLGVQLFDQLDGQVFCVSSVLDSAAGAFGDEHFSPISICTSFFESFRLSRTEEGFCFWVTSANGTLESTWDELVRFGSVDGVLTPESVCGRYLESDPETGLVVQERYTVAGEPSDAASYNAAAAVYSGGEDLGYDAQGVFLWNDMTRYDTTFDGFLAMAQDAAEAYVPLDPY